MDLGIIIAIVGSVVGGVIAIIGVLVALFLWNRGESNNDRREILTIVRSIQEEIKDFHNRLCVIEEKRKTGTEK
jgi:hypothetical protein